MKTRFIYIAFAMQSAAVHASEIGCFYREECSGISTPWWAASLLVIAGSTLAWREHSPRPGFRETAQGFLFGVIAASLVLAVAIAIR
jgi:hypothetical protein